MEIIDKVGEVELAYKPKTKPKQRLETSADCYQYFLNTYKDTELEYRESFKVVFLNMNLRPLGWTTVSTGGINNTIVDVRIILQAALLTNASMIVCCHNHPSGSRNPSRDDDLLTQKIQKACLIMNIPMLDHIVITADSYYSYSDEGRL